MSQRRLDLLFFHIGFVVLISQAVFAREFLVLFQGSEISLGIFFAAWLGWLGAGAALGIRFATRLPCLPMISNLKSQISDSQYPVSKSKTQTPGSYDASSNSRTTIHDSRFTIHALFLFLPLAALIELILLRHARAWAPTPQAEIVPIGTLALIVFFATIPVGALAGILFPLGCRLASRETGRASIGRLYGLESLGSCAGGAIFTFWWVNSFSPIVVLFILMTLAGIHVLAEALWGGFRGGWGAGKRMDEMDVMDDMDRVDKRRWWFGGGLGIVVPLVWVVACVLVFASDLATRWSAASQKARFAALQPNLELIEEVETRYQNAAIAGRGAQRILLCNGKIATSFPDQRTMDQRAAFAMAQRPGARRVLLLGGGLEGLAQALLRYKSIERVTVVEQDEELVSLVRRHLPAELRQELGEPIEGNPRLTITPMDAREFTRREPADGARFDLALIVVPDPSTAYLNRLYTKEFFESLKARMDGAGVVVCSVTSAEQYLGKDVLAYSASVFATLYAACGNVIVTPGDVNTFAASPRSGQVSSDWKELARRYGAIRPEGSSFPPDGFSTVLPEEATAYIRDKFTAANAPVNTDRRPVTYYYNMILWSRFAGSNVSGAFQALQQAGLWLLLAPLGAAVALRALHVVTRRRRRGGQGAYHSRFAAAATIIAIGFFSMAGDMLLLFTYQSVFGFVYERVGLVVSLFMLGLAAGSLVGAGARLRRPAQSLWALLAATALFAAGLPSLMDWCAAIAAPAAAEGGFFALFFLAGALCGAAFALVSLARPMLGDNVAAEGDNVAAASDSVASAGGWLDAADNWGGAAGALLTGTVMVPLLGTAQTAIGLAAVIGGALGLNLLEALPQAGRAPRRGAAWGWALAWIGVSAWIVSWNARERAAAAPTVFPETLLAQFSGKNRFELRAAPFTYARVLDSPGPEAIFSTAETAPGAHGWGGPIRLLVDMDDQTIRHLRLLEQNETPSYAGDLDAWVARFEGKPYGNGFQLGGKDGIDGISGATITSRAIIDAMNRSSYVAGTSLFGLPLDAERFQVLTWRGAFLQPANLLLLASFILMIPLYVLTVRRSRKDQNRIEDAEEDEEEDEDDSSRVLDAPNALSLSSSGESAIPNPQSPITPSPTPHSPLPTHLRTILLALNLAFLGLGANEVFTFAHVARLSVGEFSSPSAAPLLALTGIIVLGGLTLGSAFCGYICPFGILQEFISLLGDARAISPKAAFGAHRLRYVLLVAGLAAFWFSGNSPAFISFSPMQFIFSFRMTPLRWLLTAIVGIACLRYFRFWCRCFCPAGALISLTNHVALFDPWVRRSRSAVRCDVGMGTVSDVDCIRCNRCVPPRARPVNRRAQPDLPVLLAISLALILAIVWTDLKYPTLASAAAATNTGRPINEQEFQRALKSGQIVEKEALFYKQKGKGQTPSLSAPTP